MNTRSKIMAISGSTRTGSLNRRLLENAARSCTESGAQVTIVDLDHFPLPIYNGDLEVEGGLPESAQKLQQLLADHDALLISSPEYNGLPSPLLINTIDWMSRPDGERNGRALFNGKSALLVSASPGRMGGVRGLSHTRQLLNNLGVDLLPNQFTLSNASEAFGSQGRITDVATQLHLGQIASEFVKTIGVNQ